MTYGYVLDEDKENALLKIFEEEGYELGRARTSEICKEHSVSLRDYYRCLGDYKKLIGIEEIKEERETPREVARKKALTNPEWARIHAAYERLDKDVQEKDFDPSQNLAIAREVRDRLEREYRESGNCPICHRFSTLDGKPRLHSERELDESREVAALGIPD